MKNSPGTKCDDFWGLISAGMGLDFSLSRKLCLEYKIKWLNNIEIFLMNNDLIITLFSLYFGSITDRPYQLAKAQTESQ